MPEIIRNFFEGMGNVFLTFPEKRMPRKKVSGFRADRMRLSRDSHRVVSALNKTAIRSVSK